MVDDVGTAETSVVDIVQDPVGVMEGTSVADDAEGSTAFIPGNMGGAFL